MKKNLILLSFALCALQSELTPQAQESKKRTANLQLQPDTALRKSQRIAEIDSKKQFIASLVNNLPIIDEGCKLVHQDDNSLYNFLLKKLYFLLDDQTGDDNENCIQRLPEIIELAAQEVQKHHSFKKKFMIALSKLIKTNSVNPQEELDTHKNPKVRYITKNLIFMRPYVQEWLNESPHIFHAAILRKNIPIITMLIDTMHVNVNKKNIESGKTELHILAERNLLSEENISLLQLSSLFNINIQDNLGKTALMYCNNKNAFKKLLEAGAHINMQDTDGNTALHWAIKKNVALVAEELLKANPNKAIRNNQGKTAHDLITSDHMRNVFAKFP